MKQLVGFEKNYDWGSIDMIPNFIGQAPDGTKIAELWWGSHPEGPATVDSVLLTDLIKKDVAGELGQGSTSFDRKLPFLVKLLAANDPLSIQAHPSRQQAIIGFDREENDGVPLSAPSRNYRDSNHKPEVLIAMTEFRAMVGLRQISDLIDLVDELELKKFREYLLDGEDLRSTDPRNLVVNTLNLDKTRGQELLKELSEALERTPMPRDWMRDAIETTKGLVKAHPGDIGILFGLLLNTVILSPGEAIFVPSGHLHSYVHGIGLEVMASSDNVLRGGLTSKNIDVEELLKVLNPEILSDPFVTFSDEGEAILTVQDFRIKHTVVEGEQPLEALVGKPAIAVCTSGEVQIEDLHLSQGMAAWKPARESFNMLRGSGELYTIWA
ncbi:mannose-6-phosphate isomerase, class I [Corynebacterium glutamicum]|uniref:mannose-6-phosphate isomerase, class I n=1 Tax=Corynebacterium glutamicum TaxID=1718 RepID=UPI0004F934A2|nr:mannose-6-phosphate isomerase, class I [Corynebacterium glutamicum]AIK86875.1 hypothetical protein AR0_02295 [Corynebacterium glutamicum]